MIRWSSETLNQSISALCSCENTLRNNLLLIDLPCILFSFSKLNFSEFDVLRCYICMEPWLWCQVTKEVYYSCHATNQLLPSPRATFQIFAQEWCNARDTPVQIFGMLHSCWAITNTYWTQPSWQWCNALGACGPRALHHSSAIFGMLHSCWAITNTYYWTQPSWLCHCMGFTRDQLGLQCNNICHTSLLPMHACYIPYFLE